LIIQSDLFDEHPSVTVLPVTGELRSAPLFRILVEPDATNGLQKTSQIMVDKARSVPRARIGEVFGQVSAEHMLAVSRSLAVFLGVI
jgi:mRNA interferase MazF